MSSSIDRPVSNSVANFIDAFRAYQERANEIEAAKTPAERARDAATQARRHADSIRRREEIRKRRRAGASARRSALYREYEEFDTWLLRHEAMPLLLGYRPSILHGLTLFDEPSEQMEKLWERARRSVGVTLHVVNEAKPERLWRVKPHALLSWAKTKGIALPSELEPIINKTTRMAEIANVTKHSKIRERRERLRLITDKISRLIDSGALPWDRHRIHVTKKDFAEVFYLANPDLKKVKEDTLVKDLRVFSVTFKEGTKPNRNNVLRKLLDSGKLG